MSENAPPGVTLPRGLTVVVGSAGLLVAILALRQFASVLAPVLLALVVVIGVHPLTAVLQRRGVPRWLAVALTLLAVFGFIVGMALAFAVSLARLGAVLPEYQDRIAELGVDLRHWLATFGVGPEQVRAALGELSFGRVAGLVADLLLGIAETFSSLIFLLFVVLFMGLDAHHFTRRLARVDGRRAPVVRALGGFARGTRRYLVVTTVFGLVVAVVDGVFLWLVGVPSALLWGLLSFVTNYIPNIGFVIGVVPPAVLALLEGGPRLMAVVVAVYVLINFLIQSVLQPGYVGNAVDLSLTLTFLSLVFWSFVFGPVGAVLAIPLTLLAKALLLDVDPDTRWLSSLLSGSPPHDPEPEPARPPA
ncbi:AI-2E family transporter [Actinosynnema sp. NPDC047251]|uniref:Permease n=1 Tax=Saccharothrix espanaensis (strain ATCC 51144 / DSM 44229 / JCM 9112 / NBRC 15066 / NRRL 15764) TaxID=1179773 RepID=K0K314_SACES|nr:AI-2E family transporter [Saccharothrix espanaensis]CCH31982.1 hypothetical protein BN6_47030 [Saccharothrix espanaensis DSM 44229]